MGGERGEVGEGEGAEQGAAEELSMRELLCVVRRRAAEFVDACIFLLPTHTQITFCHASADAALEPG